MTKKQALKRLQEIKKSIENESISYSEIAELQALKDYIKDDVVLMEWAGIDENEGTDYVKDVIDGVEENISDVYNKDILE